MMLVLKLIVDFSDDDNDLFDNESDSGNNYFDLLIISSFIHFIVNLF